MTSAYVHSLCIMFSTRDLTGPSVTCLGGSVMLSTRVTGWYRSCQQTHCQKLQIAPNSMAVACMCIMQPLVQLCLVQCFLHLLALQRCKPRSSSSKDLEFVSCPLQPCPALGEMMFPLPLVAQQELIRLISLLLLSGSILQAAAAVVQAQATTSTVSVAFYSNAAYTRNAGWVTSQCPGVLQATCV